MRRNTQLFRPILTLLLVGLLLLLAVPASAATKSSGSTSGNTAGTDPATAKSTSQSLNDAVTKSYNADASVQIGMIVELKAKASDTVVPLPNTDIKGMLGVVIPESNASIVLTPENIKSQQVLVATSGRYEVLVSNQNGPIKVGDYVTISAVSGVGMKASETELEVIGKAAGNFTGTANVIGQVKLSNTIGKQSTVALGRIPVDLNISHNPLFQKTVDYVPGFMAKIAVSVAQHPVSVARIYLSMALLAVTGVIAGNVLYSGVRSGMIAVGRNPLSRKSIIKSLIQTVIAGLIIFVAGVFAVYLLLKL